MKDSKQLTLIFLSIGFSLLGTSGVLAREAININRDWTFTLGDSAKAETPGFDDKSWSHINLPHSFSMPYFQSNSFYVGYGLGKKLSFSAEQLAGKRVSLEFDGVFQDAEIFVNGTKAGHHQGGYNGFTCDITNAVKSGDNLVAIRVNNLWNPRLAPRAGEHVFSGGIYRNVRVLFTDPIHVAWYGTFVTTPHLSVESGVVNIKTEIRNDDRKDASIMLRTDIVDDHGTLVTTVTHPVFIPAGQTVTTDQTTQAITKPRLWHPDHPTLYTAVSTVLDGTRQADRFETSFGFRWIKFTADQGFFLNGEHYYFKGANVHQDRAGWGDAATDAAFVRDIQMVKDAGMDFIRGSHYPHAPAFTSACDRIGVMYWSENCLWGTGGQSAEGYWTASCYPTRAEDEADFEHSVEQSLRDMIRIHRNHPSIIVWSMSNEPFFTASGTLPKAATLLKKMVDLSHVLDPTRPAAIGGCQRGGIDRIGDIAGYNGDGAKIKDFQNPGIANVISEYGSTQGGRPGNYAPGFGDLSQGFKAEEISAYAWRFPWRSGESLWCGFDHGSIAGRSFGSMGFIDYYRLPKRMWFWYRNEYRHIAPPAWPVEGKPAHLKITASSPVIEHADGTDDVQLIVTVVDQAGTWINNAIPVTLTVVSGPGELPTGRSITFTPGSDITMVDGLCAIDLRAYYAGTTELKASSPGLPDATLSIPSHGAPEFKPDRNPLASERPYHSGTNQKNPLDGLQKFGLSNPTAASSEAPAHGSPLANDGDEKTSWQAADASPGAWWLVDLERIVAIQQVSLKFPTPGSWRIRIELSMDKNTWKPYFDQGTNARKVDQLVLNQNPVEGRFVRVTFTGLPDGEAAALTEFSVIGNLK